MSSKSNSNSNSNSNSSLKWIDFDQLLEKPTKYAKKLSISDLEKLVAILKEHYYETDQPLVPDFIYDEVEDILRTREPNSKILKIIDTPVAHGTTVKLPYFMGSQEKAKADSGSIQKWKNKNPGPYVISNKLDGISVLFVWKRDRKDKLKLYTRGRKGFEGQDITRIAKYIDLGKHHFVDPSLNEVAIRGELIVSHDVWKQYYSQNPCVRNWVAGMVNHKTLQIEDLKRIRFVAYELVEPKMKPSEQFQTLEKWKFFVSPHISIKNFNESELKVLLQSAEDNGQYPVDGLVIVKDTLYQRSTDENPKYSIAYKMQLEGDEAQVKVLGIEWNPSKDMLLKPVVLIEPVTLSGAKLSRATAHNAKYVVDNKIGKGAKITIVRSGKVIPYIKSVDHPAPNVHLPPYDYEWHPDGINFRLKNVNTEVYHKVLVHMAKHLEIDYLGPGVLKKLVDLGYITPTQILHLELADLEKVESLGKNAPKIYDSLQKLKTKGVRLAVLMDASNIFEAGIGTKILQSVLDQVPDLIERPADDKLKSDLTGLKGIQDKTAQKIVNGLDAFRSFLADVPDIKILEFSNDLMADNNSDNEKSIKDSDKIEAFKGMRVIFTGIRDKQLEELITQSGGEVANGLAKSHTNQAVVAKDPTGDSNKLKQARDLNVAIYSLTDFKTLYLNDNQ